MMRASVVSFAQGQANKPNALLIEQSTVKLSAVLKFRGSGLGLRVLQDRRSIIGSWGTCRSTKRLWLRWKRCRVWRGEGEIG